MLCVTPLDPHPDLPLKYICLAIAAGAAPLLLCKPQHVKDINKEGKSAINLGNLGKFCQISQLVCGHENYVCLGRLAVPKTLQTLGKS